MAGMSDLGYVDISGVIGAVLEWARNYPEPSKLEPCYRWLATLTLDGHGEEEGVSWVTFTDPCGMRWGWRWDWRDGLVPENDIPATAGDDFGDDLIHGGFTAPDGDEIRWLMHGIDSPPPPGV